MPVNRNNSSTKLSLKGHSNSKSCRGRSTKANSEINSDNAASRTRSKRSHSDGVEHPLPKQRKVNKTLGKSCQNKAKLASKNEKTQNTPPLGKRNLSSKIKPSVSALGSPDRDTGSSNLDTEYVVGSSRSLIKSIKAKKAACIKAKQVEEADEEELDYGQMDQERSVDVDGIQVQVNASEDDYEGRSMSNESGELSEVSEESSDNSDNESDNEVSFRNTTGEFSEVTDAENETDDEVEQLDRNDPRVKRLLKQIHDEEQHHEHKRTRKSAPTGGASKYIESENLITNPQLRNQMVKSPSDTTVYTPALCKKFTSPLSVAQRHVDGNADISNEISNFVESVRRETQEELQEDVRPSTSARGGTPHRRERTAAEKVIIQAEKFKAAIHPPKGNNQLTASIVELIELLKVKNNAPRDEDDEFMHVTCHIDDNLRQKIGRGEFVDLDRLIPKSRAQIMSNVKEDIEVIKKDGSTYILPNGGNKETRISSVRKWETAFRVYAAIYSEINPARSAEIWQYVHIINTAASSYAWENVAYYDVTFRQLMEKNPQRSWAKIYTQMWNLALTDQLNKTNNYNHQFGNNKPKTGQKHGDWRDRCCWRFNKGRCSKWNCRFEHRCSTKDCGAYSHNASQCPKKNKSSPPAMQTAKTEPTGSGK